MSRIYIAKISEMYEVSVCEDGSFMDTSWGDEVNPSHWKIEDGEVYIKHFYDWHRVVDRSSYALAIKEAIAHWKLEDDIESILLGSGKDE